MNASHMRLRRSIYRNLHIFGVCPPKMCKQSELKLTSCIINISEQLTFYLTFTLVFFECARQLSRRLAIWFLVVQ